MKTTVKGYDHCLFDGWLLKFVMIGPLIFFICAIGKGFWNIIFHFTKILTPYTLCFGLVFLQSFIIAILLQLEVELKTIKAFEILDDKIIGYFHYGKRFVIAYTAVHKVEILKPSRVMRGLRLFISEDKGLTITLNNSKILYVSPHMTNRELLRNKLLDKMPKVWSNGTVNLNFGTTNSLSMSVNRS